MRRFLKWFSVLVVLITSLAVAGSGFHRQASDSNTPHKRPIFKTVRVVGVGDSLTRHWLR